MGDSSDDYQKNIRAAEQAEGNKDFLKASYLFQDALTIAVQMNDSEKIAFCRDKVAICNVAAEKDFKEVVVEKSVDTKPLKEFITHILSKKDIDEILEVIAQGSSFYPRHDDVLKISEENIPIFRQFARTTTISSKGHLIRRGGDGGYSWFMDMYNIQQQFITKFCLIPLFNQLTKEKNKKKKLTLEGLIEFINRNQLIEDKTLRIIETGIRHHLNGDYVSSIHILTPMFESSFLDLSHKLGINITAINTEKGGEVSMRTVTLSEKHLESDEFIQKWGKDLCWQLIFVLFDPLGYRLRHKVAHGDIEFDECNIFFSTLILYLYIAVFGRVKKL